jgi:putative transposase
MAEVKINLDNPLVQSLLTGDISGLENLVSKVLNAALEEKTKELVGAGKYERTEDRKAYRNGYRSRWITTRLGRVQIRVPQLRGGEIDMESLKLMPKMERSLVLCLMEMYINGVSTRKVRKIMEPLCGEGVSKSMVSRLCKELDHDMQAWNSRDLSERTYPFLMADALYLKVRFGHQVIKRALLVAVGVDEKGYRHILGLTVAAKESEDTWYEFFSSLKQRGLRDVRFVISDKHEGLVRAADRSFPATSWQRCQVHFRRNVMSHVPPKRMKDVSEDMDRIFNASNSKDARAIIEEVMDKYEKDIPDVNEMLDEAKEDILAVYVLPKKYWRRFRSTNMIERLNEEIRRDDASVMRLIGSLLLEKDEEWSSGRIYLDMKEYKEAIPFPAKLQRNSFQVAGKDSPMIRVI